MRSEKSPKKEILEWVILIVIAIALAAFVDLVIVVNSIVPTGSMEPTIMTDSRMLGFRLSYLFGEPQRGDIIIFKYPDDEKQPFVKRIIGLPGETVEIIGGVTHIDGTPLDEPYLKEEPSMMNFGPFEVPEDCYFVMGDNRNHSNDARYWTNKYVSRDKILGKAFLCYWPFDRFGTLK